LFDRVKREGVPRLDIDGVTEIDFRGKSSGGHRAAGQTLAAGRAFWSWLLDRDVVSMNPWKDQKKLAEESVCGIANRALNDDEIKTLLANSNRLSQRDRTALKLMLATGLRPNEVCGAEWTEMNLKTGEWIVPGARMKYKKAPHLVYLSDYALNELKSWRKTQHGRHRFVFPSNSAKRSHLVADNLVTRCKDFDVPGFTPKVCRATVRTGLQRLECPEEVRSRISHHQRGDKVARSYDHHTYDKEAKYWWQRWGEHLTNLENNQDS